MIANASIYGKKSKTRIAAFNAWSMCLEGTAKQDAAINDTLMSIAGKRYDIYDQDDDPIWTIIGCLTASEQRRFIREVQRIMKEGK